jgi:hypothetical protein
MDKKQATSELFQQINGNFHELVFDPEDAGSTFL